MVFSTSPSIFGIFIITIVESWNVFLTTKRNLVPLVTLPFPPSPPLSSFVSLWICPCGHRTHTDSRDTGLRAWFFQQEAKAKAELSAARLGVRCVLPASRRLALGAHSPRRVLLGCPEDIRAF